MFGGGRATQKQVPRSIETQLEVILQERQAKRIGRAVGDARRLEPNAPEIRRRHIDRSISS
jgi:hypothetical protein